jgi:hypothetical protein
MGTSDLNTCITNLSTSLQWFHSTLTATQPAGLCIRRDTQLIRVKRDIHFWRNSSLWDFTFSQRQEKCNCLLECRSTQSGKNWPMMRLTTLMTEAVSTSETMANFHQTTQQIIPDDSHIQCIIPYNKCKKKQHFKWIQNTKQTCELN